MVTRGPGQVNLGLGIERVFYASTDGVIFHVRTATNVLLFCNTSGVTVSNLVF